MFDNYDSILFFLFGFFITVTVHANNDLISPSEKAREADYKVLAKRSFKSLDPFPDAHLEDDISFYESDSYIRPSTDDLKIRNEIEATFNKVVSENRFVEFLDANALVDLPIGIKSDVGVATYTILIDSLILTPEGTLLFASMSFEAPNLGKKIHFRGAGIKFSKSGGLVDGGILELVGDYPIPLSGGNSEFLLKGSNRGTFVEFDCNGFKQMSIDGALRFSRNLLLPEDEQGEIIDNENVSIDFTTVLMDWNDLLVGVYMPRFQIKGLKGFSFEVHQAVLDFSDLQNAPSTQFPPEYAQVSPYLQSGNANLWRGIYIGELSVTLPKQFNSTGDNASRVAFAGYNMVIDDQGFSGILSAQNLIPIDKGKIGNWNFSLDEINVSLIANELNGAGFDGKINIPINR